MRIKIIVSSVVATLFGLGLLFAAPAKSLAAKSIAESKTVTLHEAGEKGEGQVIGNVTFEDVHDGMQIIVDLHDLTPNSSHGFHIHTNPSCAPAEKDGKMVPALAAGGHYDPKNTGKHLGPNNPQGHAGDLPFLTSNAKGVSKQSFVIHSLKVKDLVGRSVMVHAGGDNYSDQPKPLGGGGARMACGVIE